MARIRLFLDEDIYGATTTGLRKGGLDVLSTPEAGRRGKTDESQLEWASNDDRAIVTFNVAHFVHLHSQWMAQGRHHAGMIVSTQRPIGDLIRRLLHLANTLDADSVRNRLEFLSDW